MSIFIEKSIEFLPLLAQGLKLTILVTLGTIVCSTLLGLVWALMRISNIWILKWISIIAINVIRGIPIIVVLFFVYFVLPDLGLSLTSLQAGIIGLSIAYSAYHAENFRAGIEAIDRGQVEAAQSMGMGWGLMMRRVLLPQAIKIVLPSYGNMTVSTLKDSSQTSTITVAELALKGKLIASSTFQSGIVFALVAAIYLLMSIPLTMLIAHFEKRGRK